MTQIPVISRSYPKRRRVATSADSGAIPQIVGQICKMLRKRGESTRGFTMIELMVVMVVITVVASVVFTGVRQDTFDSSYRKFTDDIYGSIVSARNRAIDDQTVVTLSTNTTAVVVSWRDPISGMNEELWRHDLERVNSGILEQHVCMYGFFDGVQAPGMEYQVGVDPSGCDSGSTTLIFRPDGTFDFPQSVVGNAGVTLVIGDQRVNPAWLTLIEVFPGGMIRKFDNVQQVTS